MLLLLLGLSLNTIIMISLNCFLKIKPWIFLWRKNRLSTIGFPSSWTDSMRHSCRSLSQAEMKKRCINIQSISTLSKRCSVVSACSVVQVGGFDVLHQEATLVLVALAPNSFLAPLCGVFVARELLLD